MKRVAAAFLLFLAWAGRDRAGASEQLVTPPGQEGITMPVLYEEAANPIASVILFVGGDGDLAHQTNSFLLRVRGQFVAAGMSVAVPDTPSDHPGGFGPLFRTWTAHTTDIGAVVAFLKGRALVPVWAVGNSNGTISAASGAALLGPRNIAGIVLTSAVWLGGLGLVPVEKIAVPVLVIGNRLDACPASLLTLSEQNMRRFVAAPDKKLMAVSGNPSEGPRCGTGSPHDFYGVEDQAVPPIIDWIRTHDCEDPGANARPHGASPVTPASSAGLRCVSPPAGSQRRPRRGAP